MEGSRLLRKFRQTQKPPLSQEDAAKAVKTTKATISRIESGTRNPSLTLAAKLSKWTGIPIDRFVKQDGAAQ